MLSKRVRRESAVLSEARSRDNLCIRREVKIVFGLQWHENTVVSLLPGRVGEANEHEKKHKALDVPY
jgi:hypothetical protein